MSTIHKLIRWKTGGLDITIEDSKTGRTSKKDFAQYARTKTRLTCWQEMPSGKVITGLTPEEVDYYEVELGIDKVKYPQGLQPNSRYWSENGPFLTQDGLYLDEEVPYDAMWIKVLSARGDVETSTAKAKSNPRTEYLLTNQDSEATAKVEKRDYLKKAMALLTSMSIQDMKDYLIMVNQYSTTMSERVVEDKVGDIAEGNPKLFIELYNSPDKKEKILIQELVNHRIILKSGTSLYTDNQGQQLAYSEEQMIAYIKNPENNQVVIGFKKQLASIKKAK